ncbi:RDD family protein [Arthrobacter silvisoli]|uniref:RDD family protein n=1 Tax=Arthrobacter silvisoli TaxID=2291022 RepID=UPI000E218E92|nr:RDD family protein [Arthrobacter silvisoli]
MSSIITGEAVVLELRPASFAARALGLILDLLVYFVLLMVVMLLVGSLLPDLDEAAGRTLILFNGVLCLVIVPVAVETLSRGRSVGKLAVGLRIVRDDGGSIRFRHAVIRGLIGFLEIFLTFGGLAVAVALFNDKSKRLGDIVAGTYALRQRVQDEVKVFPFAPPYLQGWVAMADIGRIPDAAARRATQFVQQAPRMAPASRINLAMSLATELSAHVAPPPPLGTLPEDYLWAVLGERRNRELKRLTRAEERSRIIGERLARTPFS